MPPEKRDKEGKAEKGTKTKEKKRRRKVNKNNLEEIKKSDKIPNVAKTKTKSKTKRKLRKKTLSKLIEKPSGFPLQSKDIEEKENLFTLRTKGPGLTRDGKKPKGGRRARELKALEHDRKPSKERGMAAGGNKASERGRKDVSEKKRRKKPHALPPLPRAPKSPVTPSPTTSTSSAETPNYRTFIGSPPPTALRKKEEAQSIEAWRKIEEEDSGEDAFLDEEITAYSPTPSLEQSYPKITIKKAPVKSAGDDVNESPPLQENAIVSASSSGRSGKASVSSLIHSTSSLNLNSSLSLPPKLLTYVAEDGSTSVQEWVPEDRVLSAASTRRSSTPSIKDLPSPLRGVSPLEIPPKRPPEAKKLSKPKLSPLTKES